jgi:ankyrin repeat protein
VVEALLKKGFDPNKRDYRDMTSLYIAASIKNTSVDVIRILLHYGANPNALCWSPAYSPLHIALQVTAKLDIIKILVDHGANVNLQVNSNRLNGTVTQPDDNPNVGDVDLFANIAPPAFKPRNHTPFAVAALNSRTRPQVFMFLLQHGADPHTPDSCGVTAHQRILRRSNERKVFYETLLSIVAMCAAKTINRVGKRSLVKILPVNILWELRSFLWLL